MTRLLHSVDGCEIWHGDCLDPETVAEVMQGRTADLLHVDAPYSARTHEGHESGKVTVDKARHFAETRALSADSRQRGHARYAAKAQRASIEYEPWSPETVSQFANIWLPVTRGWATTITDHVLAPAWSDAFTGANLYTFPPLPWVEIGSRVRMTGDGPSSWSCHTIVARPKGAPYSKWGTLPGAYVGPAENKQSRPDRITGGKSLALTQAFLADYSRRGDLVLDPCLGGGTTMLAARMTGRRCIGIEQDPARAQLCARLITTKREQVALW